MRLVLAFLVSAWAVAQTSPPVAPRKADPLRFWLDALDYVERSGDDDAMLRLKTAIIDEKFAEWPLVTRLFELEVAEKDRPGLHELYGRMLAKHFCTVDSVTCRRLRLLWEGNLDSVSFNESTAALMEKARRMLVTKDCREAVTVLKQIEAQEGAYFPQLWASREAHACLGEAEAVASLDQRIAELRYKTDAP
jgi:hypothetical protein